LLANGASGALSDCPRPEPASRDYVTAARALGAGDLRIVWHQPAAGVISISFAEFVQLSSRLIPLQTSLAFLSGAWLWWVLPSGLLITAAVLGFALPLGQALSWSVPVAASCGAHRGRGRQPDFGRVGAARS
jgi:ABC-type dipeptide/oligopeptide/nickel transport system permease subunit